MNETQISEETIASMVEAAQNIATDSTAMRQSMVAIAKRLQPVIKSAGIEFGIDDPSQWWRNGDYTNRIGVRRHFGEWEIGVQKTMVDPDMHDYPFAKWAYYQGAAEMAAFDLATIKSIAAAIKHLPEFLVAYAEEIEQHNINFADLREKADAMREIMEG